MIATQLQLTDPPANIQLHVNTNLNVTLRDANGDVADPVTSSLQLMLRVVSGNVTVKSGSTVVVPVGGNSATFAFQLAGKVESNVVLEVVALDGSLTSDQGTAFSTLAGPPYKIVLTQGYSPQIVSGVARTGTVQLQDESSNPTNATMITSGSWVGQAGLTTNYGVGIGSGSWSIAIGANSGNFTYTPTTQHPKVRLVITKTGGHALTVSAVVSLWMEILPGAPTALVLQVQHNQVISSATPFVNTQVPNVLIVSLRDAAGNRTFATQDTVVKLVRQDGTQNAMSGTIQGTIKAKYSSVILANATIPAVVGFNETVKATKVSGHTVTDSSAISLLSSYVNKTRRVYLGIGTSGYLFGRSTSLPGGEDDLYRSYNDSDGSIKLAKRMGPGSDVAKTLVVKFPFHSSTYPMIAGEATYVRVVCVGASGEESPAPFDIAFKLIVANRSLSPTVWYPSKDFTNNTIPSGTILKGTKSVLVAVTPTLPGGATTFQLSFMVMQDACFDAANQSHTESAGVHRLTSVTADFYRKLAGFAGNGFTAGYGAMYYESQHGGNYLFNSSKSVPLLATDIEVNSGLNRSKTDPAAFNTGTFNVKVAVYAGGFAENGMGASSASPTIPVVSAVPTQYAKNLLTFDPPDSHPRSLTLSQVTAILRKIERPKSPHPQYTTAENNTGSGSLISARCQPVDSQVLAAAVSLGAVSEIDLDITPGRPALPNQQLGFNVASNISSRVNLTRQVEVLPQKTAVVGLNWNHETRALSGVGAFTSWAWTARMYCKVTAGAGVSIGTRVQVSSRTDADEIILASDISFPPATTLENGDIEVELCEPPFYGLRFTSLPSIGWVKPGESLSMTVELYDLDTGLAVPAPEDILITLTPVCVADSYIRFNNPTVTLPEGDTDVTTSVTLDRAPGLFGARSHETFAADNRPAWRNQILTNVHRYDSPVPLTIEPSPLALSNYQVAFKAEVLEPEWNYVRANSWHPANPAPTGYGHVYCGLRTDDDAEENEQDFANLAYLYVEEHASNLQGEQVYAAPYSAQATEEMWQSGLCKIVFSGATGAYANMNGTWYVPSRGIFPATKLVGSEVIVCSFIPSTKSMTVIHSNYLSGGFLYPLQVNFTNTRTGTGLGLIGPLGTWVGSKAPGDFSIVGNVPSCVVSLQ